MANKAGHRGFGNARKLKSGRWQARYIGPDVAEHKAPATFGTKGDAEAWLGREQTLIASGGWTSPAARRAAVQAEVLTFGAFAEDWLLHRRIKPRTRQHYRKLLDAHILPVVGGHALDALTPDTVRSWYSVTCPTTPTMRAHCYSLLRSILHSAVGERLMVSNPCIMRGAGNAKRASKTEPATLDELGIIVDTVPARYKLMILLASWCALRFGELTELRGHDFDAKRGVLKIRRAVVWVDGGAVVGRPKSAAGVRDVAIPPHLLPAVRGHLEQFGIGAQDLMFPAARDHSAHMRPATLTKVYYRAREAAGRPDLRFHDLRHTGAVLAASTGATLAELMGRLGHSTPGAALKYQHSARGRDTAIAAALSELAGKA